MQIWYYYWDTKNVNEFLFYATIKHVLMKNVYNMDGYTHVCTHKGMDGWLLINIYKKLSRTENNELLKFINLWNNEKF